MNGVWRNILTTHERKLSGQQYCHRISIYCPDPRRAKDKLLHVDLYTIQSFLQHVITAWRKGGQTWKLWSWNRRHRQTYPELGAAGSKSLGRGRNWLTGDTHASYWNPKVHRGQEDTEITAVMTRSMDPQRTHYLSLSLSALSFSVHKPRLRVWTAEDMRRTTLVNWPY